METPESVDSKALTAILNMAITSDAYVDERGVIFSEQALMKFCEKISAQVFHGTCHMICDSIVNMVNSTKQQVDLANSVTEGELNGTSRTGSH